MKLQHTESTPCKYCDQLYSIHYQQIIQVHFWKIEKERHSPIRNNETRETDFCRQKHISTTKKVVTSNFNAKK